MSNPILCQVCDNKNCYINKFCTEKSKLDIDATKIIQNFKAKQRIFSAGSPMHGIHFVYNGKVNVFHGEDDHHDHFIRLARTGDILGHRGLGSRMTYQISATALGESQLCFIPTATFMNVLSESPRLTQELMMYYAEELNKVEMKFFDAMKRTVKCRLAGVLLQLKDMYGLKEATGELDVAISRKDLANLAVTSYETVIRALTDFETQGFIGCVGKRIRLLNHPELERISNTPNFV